MTGSAPRPARRSPGWCSASTPAARPSGSASTGAAPAAAHRTGSRACPRCRTSTSPSRTPAGGWRWPSAGAHRWGSTSSRWAPGPPPSCTTSRSWSWRRRRGRCCRGRRPRARAAAFATYWTRKEAAVKATGTGLLAPLPELVVSPRRAPPRVLRWGGPGQRPRPSCARCGHPPATRPRWRWSPRPPTSFRRMPARCSDEPPAVLADHPQPPVAVALQLELHACRRRTATCCPAAAGRPGGAPSRSPPASSGTVRGSGPRLCRATSAPSSQVDRCASTSGRGWSSTWNPPQPELGRLAVAADEQLHERQQRVRGRCAGRRR